MANTRLYDEAYFRLHLEGFSESEANSYALSYVLSRYNTGLKISFRPNSTSEFQQQSIEIKRYSDSPENIINP
jgi:hypothetical protein